VRVEAVALVFSAVHRRPDVARALERTRDHDASPNVRKQAGLRAPGGVLFRRTSPYLTERSSARKHLNLRLVRS
jgi:hypothetical protein